MHKHEVIEYKTLFLKLKYRRRGLATDNISFKFETRDGHYIKIYTESDFNFYLGPVFSGISFAFETMSKSHDTYLLCKISKNFLNIRDDTVYNTVIPINKTMQKIEYLMVGRFEQHEK